MRMIDILVGLRSLKATIADMGECEQILLRWAADGILSPPRPETTIVADTEWPDTALAEAAAIDVMFFRHGFSKGTLQAVHEYIADEAISDNVNDDILASIEDMMKPVSDYYLPCVLWLIAFGKARAGIPANEQASLEVWTEGRQLKFQRIALDTQPSEQEIPFDEKGITYTKETKEAHERLKALKPPRLYSHPKLFERIVRKGTNPKQ